jgi:hypothetical protein
MILSSLVASTLAAALVVGCSRGALQMPPVFVETEVVQRRPIRDVVPATYIAFARTVERSEERAAA